MEYGRIIVTLHSASLVSALEKCCREETLSMRAAYETAVQTRVMRERAQRSGAKPCLARRGRL